MNAITLFTPSCSNSKFHTQHLLHPPLFSERGIIYVKNHKYGAHPFSFRKLLKSEIDFLGRNSSKEFKIKKSGICNLNKNYSDALNTSIVVSDLSSNKPTTLPNKNEIQSFAHRRGIRLVLTTFGPFFSVTAQNESDEKVLCKAEGFIKPWFSSNGKILHLDKIRLAGPINTTSFSFFGVSLLVGSLCVRHGYDCGCLKAELLAINDTDEYHEKLVKYYTRMGFTKIYEVNGGSIGDMTHMLVWGGIGTRMDGNIIELLRKWSNVLKKST